MKWKKQALLLTEEEALFQWRIVDCLPEDVGCGGTHAIIQSTGATDGNSCPYDDIAPWQYCTGDLTPVGCNEYTSDATAKFDCL